MATEEIHRPPSFPPYPEIIMAAIEELNESSGSNKSSISKFIESKYGDLPAGHSKLLSDHLNMMKENGELVFWKNNYMKRDPNAPPRRGRGRPPKDPNAPVKAVNVKVASGSGRPRGRPRKMARPAGGLGAPSRETEVGGMGGRPRGRPPKVNVALTEVSVE